ncbi:MAG: hypothetical protein EPN72_12290 [Nevskiaceae bacterium]|nr:MAG: hypothetical protein EPN63_00685 [Nevskiaceae bacterium]TBR71955.1 MAG: hypothetical protein EPN72_12290 [Nevskiaceae bacterium]
MREVAGCVAGLVFLGLPALASADGYFSDLWSNTVFTGSLQYNLSVRTDGDQNQYNQSNLPFQDVAVPRQAYLPNALSTGALNAVGNLLGLAPGSLPAAGASDFTIPIPGYADTVRRGDYAPKNHLPFNNNMLRFNGRVNTPLGHNLTFVSELRVAYVPTLFSNRYNATAFGDTQGGITGGDYYNGPDTGNVNYFDAKGRNGKRLNPLELSSSNYMADLPTLVLNYRNGPFSASLGNQTIAWGQGIFLRTLDVPNGLDFRRHLILDRAIEEYQDKRVSSPALRVMNQVTNDILIDGFVEKFQPTILPNSNTPYNVIPSAFYTPLDNYYVGGYDTKLNYGFRIKADYGTWGWTLMAVRRYNPNGVYSWGTSGINKGLPTSPVTTLGNLVTTAYNLKLEGCGAAYNPTTCRLFPSTGAALASSPLTVGPGGVYSGKEWFATAGSAHLNGLAAFNNAINEYASLRDLYADNQSTVAGVERELNTFFMGSGGSLRGTVQRDYYAENNFGAGLSYVTASEHSLLDSIILNLEATYTPYERLTDPGLAHGGLKTSEYVIGFDAEKWTRWSDAYPAAYLVFEYQRRSASDLVGLSLKGYRGNTGTTDPIVPTGISSANYLVFAGFQPTPSRLFVFEWAVLWDIQGGMLFQPNVRYAPGHNINVDLFYNYVNGNLYGNPTKNVVSDINNDNEITLRVTYGFQ